MNFSRVAELALFTEGLSEDSLTFNMSCLDEDIDIMNNSLKLLIKNDDDYFAIQVMENLFLTLMVILSYLNDDMARDHIFFYKSVPLRNDELLQKASGMATKIVSIFIDLAKDKKISFMEDSHLDTLFSIYLILLYESKKLKRGRLIPLFKEVHKMMEDLLEAYSRLTDSTANDTLYKYFRMLVLILRNNHYYKLATDFDVPKYIYSTGSFGIIPESEYPQPIVGRRWYVKRPTVQRNGYYYNDVEKSFGIDD